MKKTLVKCFITHKGKLYACVTEGYELTPEIVIHRTIRGDGKKSNYWTFTERKSGLCGHPCHTINEAVKDYTDNAARVDRCIASKLESINGRLETCPIVFLNELVNI